MPVPKGEQPDVWASFGISCGYALLQGIRHHFMLDAAEIDFELEGPWKRTEHETQYWLMSLAFIDPSLGGSGYLNRVADGFQEVAKKHWFLLLLAVALTAAPWIPRRFTLRTLLMATTLFAVVLGMIVWLR